MPMKNIRKHISIFGFIPLIYLISLYLLFLRGYIFFGHLPVANVDDPGNFLRDNSFNIILDNIIMHTFVISFIYILVYAIFSYDILDFKNKKLKISKIDLINLIIIIIFIFHIFIDPLNIFEWLMD